MLENLKTLFTRGEKQTPDGLDQDQREALIDLLLLCIYADNDMELAEERIFDRKIERFNWTSELPIDDYIQASKLRTHHLIQPGEKRKSHLEDIGSRLKKKDIKFQALKLCKVLFYSHLVLIEDEEVLIKEIRAAFGLK